MQAPGDARGGRPWGLALLLLAAMGALFFSSYGFANWLASQRAEVPFFHFGWERHIPFLPWSILPYWSIDLLYGLSFFLWATRTGLLTHVKRLLTAQLVSIACFVVFPLRFAFARPATDGLPGQLFTLLGGFDKPFNQAPSLHISLLVILWVAYAAHLPGQGRGAWRWPIHCLVHGWFALIGVSVLTTYQHHAIDLPTGWLLGWLCVFAWPLPPGDVPGDAPAADPRSRQLAARYGCGALFAGGLTLLALQASVLLALLLGWTALALACVARCYRRGDPQGFQKGEDGRMAPAARWVLAPYLLGAYLNSRWWTRTQPAAQPITERVCIGRLPTSRELRRLGVSAVLDLSAELPRLATVSAQENAGAPAARPWGRSETLAYHCVPMLDLVVPPPAQLRRAVAALNVLEQQGHTVLVCCALGYSRSALVLACWLAQQRRCADLPALLAWLRQRRPQMVLGAGHIAALHRFTAERRAA